MSEVTARADSAAVLEVRGLSKWFGEVTALDRVDCTVERATVHGLVGANGAGKSTLLSVLFGLVRPDEGELRLFGRTQRDAGPAWLDGVGGFVESPRFYPHLTGRANLAVLASLDRGDSDALIDEVLDLVELGSVRSQKVKGYSLGMRQRLGLASAIIRRPTFLILDEPTNGLDPAGTHALHAALRSARQRGVSVLFSSHDVAQVDELCDDVTVLDRGGVVFSGSAERLRAETPAPDWLVRTDDDRAALQLAATAGLRVQRSGDALRVAADQAGLGRYLIALSLAAVTIRSLEQADSPLEALLLRLNRADRFTDDARPARVTAAAR